MKINRKYFWKNKPFKMVILEFYKRNEKKSLILRFFNERFTLTKL